MPRGTNPTTCVYVFYRSRSRPLSTPITHEREGARRILATDRVNVYQLHLLVTAPLPLPLSQLDLCLQASIWSHSSASWVSRDLTSLGAANIGVIGLTHCVPDDRHCRQYSESGRSIEPFRNCLVQPNLSDSLVDAALYHQSHGAQPLSSSTVRNHSIQQIPSFSLQQSLPLG